MRLVYEWVSAIPFHCVRLVYGKIRITWKINLTECQWPQHKWEDGGVEEGRGATHQPGEELKCHPARGQFLGTVWSIKGKGRVV